MRQAIGSDIKGKISPVLYLIGIAASVVAPFVGLALYTAVAVIWLVPDPRMERMIALSESTEDAAATSGP